MDKIEKIKVDLNDYILKCKKSCTPLVDKSPECILPNLKQRASDYIESASSLIDIKYNFHMGRHIIASSDIDPGNKCLTTIIM